MSSSVAGEAGFSFVIRKKNQVSYLTHWFWLLMHQRGWHLVLYKERTRITAAQERRRSSLP